MYDDWSVLVNVLLIEVVLVCDLMEVFVVYIDDDLIHPPALFKLISGWAVLAF